MMKLFCNIIKTYVCVFSSRRILMNNLKQENIKFNIRIQVKYLKLCQVILKDKISILYL